MVPLQDTHLHNSQVRARFLREYRPRIGISSTSKTILVEGKQIQLSNGLYFLIVHLALNQGECLSRTELVSALARAFQKTVSERTVDVWVQKLRKKLNKVLADSSRSVLVTVRHTGYCFNPSCAVAVYFDGVVTGNGIRPIGEVVPIQISRSDRIILRGNETTHIKPSLHILLLHFVTNPKQIISLTKLAQLLLLSPDHKSFKEEIRERSVAVYIHRLRRLLDRISEGASEMIELVRGKGYRFKSVFPVVLID